MKLWRTGKSHSRRLNDLDGWSSEYRSYMEQLILQFDLLSDVDRESSAYKVAEAIKAKAQNPQTKLDLTVEDVDTLETAFRELQSVGDLRADLPGIRYRFEQLVGDGLIRAYPPLNAEDMKVEANCRAYAISLISEIHRTYRDVPGRERLRRRLALQVAFVSFGIVAFGLIVILLSRRNWFGAAFYYNYDPINGLEVSGQAGSIDLPRFNGMLSTGGAAIIAGAIGGYASMLRRLQQVSSESNFLTLWHGRISLYAAPVSGAIFALLLYLLCVAGLLDGTMFPKITEGLPAGTANYGKLFVWAFISGFAEKFVPDILDRVITKKDKDEKAK